jgi:cysteine desulfuration protein SufE
VAASASAVLPPRLHDVVDEFCSLPREERLHALLDYAEMVPPLPPELAAHHERLERVHECQTPFFLATELDGERVRLYFDAPDQAPTTRGFAGILSAGLDGATVEQVLGTPDDFYTRMGLAEAISPLRLRGMGAILGRIKRQVRIAAGRAA